MLGANLQTVLKYKIKLMMPLLGANALADFATIPEIGAVFLGLGALLAALAYMLKSVADFCKSSKKGDLKLAVLATIILSCIAGLIMFAFKVVDVWTARFNETELATIKAQWIEDYAKEFESEVRWSIGDENLIQALVGVTGDLVRVRDSLVESNKNREPLFEEAYMIQGEAQVIVDSISAYEVYCMKSQEMLGRTQAARVVNEFAKAREVLVVALYPELYSTNRTIPVVNGPRDVYSSSVPPKLTQDQVYERRGRAIEAISLVLENIEKLRVDILEK